MSRGLGQMQRDIKRLLDATFDAVGPLQFAGLRALFIIHYGGDPDRGDTLNPTRERSLKRALKGLIDRCDVLIHSGAGGPGDPRRYITVERFASMTGEKIKDTRHAKAIVAELAEAVSRIGPRGLLGSSAT